MAGLMDTWKLVPERARTNSAGCCFLGSMGPLALPGQGDVVKDLPSLEWFLHYTRQETLRI